MWLDRRAAAGSPEEARGPDSPVGARSAAMSWPPPAVRGLLEALPPPDSSLELLRTYRGRETVGREVGRAPYSFAKQESGVRGSDPSHTSWI